MEAAALVTAVMEAIDVAVMAFDQDGCLPPPLDAEVVVSGGLGGNS